MQLRTSSGISEPRLRQCVRHWLAVRYAGRGARIVEEFPIERGGARVDFAVLSDRLDAFELKSDYDDFGRLHNQIHAYNRVFSHIWMVTGPALAQEIGRIVPSWWGLLSAMPAPHGEELMIVERRPALASPGREAFSVASLLWRDEARALLQAHALALPRKATTHFALCERLAAALPVGALETAVLERLRERQRVATASKQ